ncbi:uncharacterized protein LOC129410512 [Boleophthalmus pectinirostris]|uniref:uncharacterized protein LOC129410512 n=1 Tax=Boleophthalmus pectinirostris TaxID=150288 RepID=UPI00242B06AE|nr:uncharacterized protein LOC129410512 [Boleophthalmus pectinirostris]
MVIQVKVSTPRGQDILIDVCPSADRLKHVTVKQLREMIARRLAIGGDVRMVFQGKPLDDCYTLRHYNIGHMSKIQTLLTLPGGACTCGACTCGACTCGACTCGACTCGACTCGACTCGACTCGA